MRGWNKVRAQERREESSDSRRRAYHLPVTRLGVPSEDDANLIVPIQDDGAHAVELLTNNRTHFTLVRKAPELELRNYRAGYLEQEHGRERGLACMRSVGDDWDEFLWDIYSRRRVDDVGGILVSLIFCHPRSIVFRDLKHNHTYLNLRSGEKWDLNFVGYDCPGISYFPPSVAGIPLWRFKPAIFDSIRQRVQDEHARALSRWRKYLSFNTGGWRYSGRPELVSFMVYNSAYPVHVDWPSLRAVPLLDANGKYIDRSLDEIVEVLSDWRDHDTDALRDLAPGELPAVVSAWPIAKALRATASVLAAGIAGNAAYELLKAVLR